MMNSNAEIERQAARVRKLYEQALGLECPQCGGKDIEDNGASEHRCCACDHRWEASELEISL